jgi:hypothetical protein
MTDAAIALDPRDNTVSWISYEIGSESVTHKMPNPRSVTKPNLTLNFKFKLQNTYVEKIAR